MTSPNEDLLDEHSKRFASLVSNLLTDARIKDAQTMADMATAMTRISLSVERGFGDLSEQTGQIMSKLAQLDTRMGVMETSITQLQTNLSAVTNEHRNLQKEIESLQSNQAALRQRLEKVEEQVSTKLDG